MAILITKYKTGVDFPPLRSGLTHVVGENTLTFPYKTGDGPTNFSNTSGVHLLLINGGSLTLTDDTDTFSVAFGASDITITWHSQRNSLRDIDDVVFVFNAFAKPLEGVTRLLYTATAGQTVFTGNDVDGTALTFRDGGVLVFQNDNYLETTDYNTNTANTVELNTGATAGDKISIIAFDSVTDQTDLNNAVANKLPLAGGTMTGNIVMSGLETVDGRDLSVDGAKLDGIESGATADQTAAEIRTLVENATDSNVFTDADHTKLDAIEASADVTDTTNVVAALTAGTNITIANDGTISSAATLTDAQIKTQYENNANTNAFTDALQTKLNGIETGATADQTASEIRTLVNSATDSNVFTDADHTKLDGIETSADVTDTANVTAAGALMTSSILNINQITQFDATDYATAAQGTKADAALPKAGGTMTGNIVMSGLETVDGRDVSLDGAKLDGIESGATADQTASEIRTLVDSATDSNVFTDADHTKLGGIETGATADQTATEILTAIKTVDGANSGLDADLLDGQEGSYYTNYADNAVANLVDSAPTALDTLNELAAALGDDANFSTTVNTNIASKLPLAGGTMTGVITFASGQLFDTRDVSADGTKLDGIESGATADQTAAEIRTLVESATDSNVFTDADHTKLGGIETGATADQTAAEIRALVESATDSNVFTDGDHTKLDGIETSADVTDTANVTSAGALMTTGGIMSGNLDLNGNELILDADGDTSITADTDDLIDFKVGGTDKVELTPSYFRPKSSAIIALGSSARRWLSIHSFTGNFLGQLTLGVADGTAPMAVTSTTKVSNLNADKLDDQEGSYYLDAGNLTGTVANARLDGELQALAGLTSAADKGIQFTGSGTAATYDLTTAGKALLDDADAAAQRTTLGLGTIATQAANNVDIDGGSIDGVSIGTNSVVSEVHVDGLKLSGSTLEGVTGNNNLTIEPAGTGDINLFAATINLGEIGGGATLQSAGTGSLTIAPSSFSGSIVMEDATNSNITLTPGGTGSVVLDGLSYPQADGTNGQVLTTDGSGGLSFTTVSGGLSNVVEDTAPQLGGVLDANGNNIDLNGGTITDSNDDAVEIDAALIIDPPGGQTQYAASISDTSATFYRDVIISGNTDDLIFDKGTYTTTLSSTNPAAQNQTVTLPDATGTAVVEETGGVTLNNGLIDLKNGGSPSEVRLFCESSNAHYAALKAPAHADFSGDVASTLPTVTGTLISTGDTGTVATGMIADDAVTAAKLANTTVTAGSYTAADITVDAQGRITSASNGSAGGGTFTSDVTISSFGTNASANLMLNNVDTSSNFGKAIEAFRSGIGTGQRNQIMLGKDGSTYDTASLSFYYAGNASSSNRFEVGFWGADSLLNVLANGNVGIGNTSPSYKLDVAGDINFTGSLYQNGSAFSGGGGGGSYANSDVDTHLNTSTASANEVLSWNGSDYDWVAQSGGGGATNLTGLSDVTISSVQNNDLLMYNSTAGEWQNTNLGLTIDPSVQSMTAYGGSTLVENNLIDAVIAPSSGSYQNPAYFAEVRNAANTSTVISNANITKSGNTLSFTGPAAGNYIFRVKVQDFGDLQSEFVNQSFTTVVASGPRYVRLRGTGGSNHTMILDCQFFTGTNGTAIEYPAAIGHMTSKTTNDNTSGLSNQMTVSSSGHHSNYQDWEAFDSNTTGTGSSFWNLGYNGTYADYYLQLDIGQATINIQSAKVSFHPSYSGGAQTLTLLGSSTGAFAGEETTIATYSKPSSGGTFTIG